MTPSSAIRTAVMVLPFPDLPTWRKNRPAKSADLMEPRIGTTLAGTRLIEDARIERERNDVA